MVNSSLGISSWLSESFAMPARIPISEMSLAESLRVEVKKDESLKQVEEIKILKKKPAKKSPAPVFITKPESGTKAEGSA